MDLIHAIILGIIEGITEFLPISSTGHLILASNLLKISQTEFVKTFEIAIQSGAILSVIVLYWKTFVRDFNTLKKVLTAFIPTAAIGFILYKLIKQYLIGNSDIVLISLFLGGIVLIAIELLMKRGVSRDKDKTPTVNLSYERAFMIGVFQSISVIPGVSRAAATIIGGLIVGLPREKAVEFSFLLAVPTMIAATALDLKETSFSFTPNEWSALTIGFVVSFIIALIVIKWLLKYIQRNNFIPFGIYRIVLSLLYFLLIMRS